MSAYNILRRTACIVLVACVGGGPLVAGEFSNFPGAATDQRTIDAQRQVEELFEQGEYERALIIYEKDLAPIGDKYAQYMVGYMHLHGKGVPKNLPRALAWYRLAAERGDAPILQERDALYHRMTHEQVVESNRIFVELWRELGDNNLLLDLIRKDMDALRARTGSRIPSSGSSPITVVDVRRGESSGDTYYDRIQSRLEIRINYLDSNVEILDLDLEENLSVKKSLELEVREEMAALGVR